MFGSAGVPMVQEHCMAKYNASIEELLYHCYLGSTGISFLLALTSGELVQGISFLVNGPNGSIGTWVSAKCLVFLLVHFLPLTPTSASYA